MARHNKGKEVEVVGVVVVVVVVVVVGVVGGEAASTKTCVTASYS